MACFCWACCGGRAWCALAWPTFAGTCLVPACFPVRLLFTPLLVSCWWWPMLPPSPPFHTFLVSFVRAHPLFVDRCCRMRPVPPPLLDFADVAALSPVFRCVFLCALRLLAACRRLLPPPASWFVCPSCRSVLPRCAPVLGVGPPRWSRVRGGALPAVVVVVGRALLVPGPPEWNGSYIMPEFCEVG